MRAERWKCAYVIREESAGGDSSTPEKSDSVRGALGRELRGESVVEWEEFDNVVSETSNGPEASTSPA